jgi:uncharacterized protein
MWIDLQPVREEPFAWHEAVTVPAGALDREEVAELSPVELEGRLSFVDPGFYLQGRLRYRQTLVCPRCLAQFSEPVESDLELLVRVDPEALPEGEAEGERQLAEEDLGVLTLAEERLQTDPLILEQLQLNVPMKPICRPDCRGLCPRCGQDRNQGECGCREETADPRWSALAGLRERLDKSGGA